MLYTSGMNGRMSKILFDMMASGACDDSKVVLCLRLVDDRSVVAEVQK
jgi:hypothetical protein